MASSCHNNDQQQNTEEHSSNKAESDSFDIHDHDDASFAGSFFYRTEQINVLVVGRSQTGKSGLMEVLRNPRFHSTKTGFAVTRDPNCCRLVLYTKDDGKLYQINIIDTPGLEEVTKNSADQRSDQEILKLSELCIKSSVTTLNCICFVSEASRTHQNDVNVFRQLIQFVGNAFSENSVLVLTHADKFADKELNKFKDDIASHEKTRDTYAFCKLGVLFHGAVDYDDIETLPTENLRKDVADAKLKRLASLRQQLVQCFISTKGKPQVIDKIQRLIAAKEEEEAEKKELQLQITQKDQTINQLQQESQAKTTQIIQKDQTIKQLQEESARKKWSWFS